MEEFGAGRRRKGHEALAEALLHLFEGPAMDASARGWRLARRLGVYRPWLHGCSSHAPLFTPCGSQDRKVSVRFGLRGRSSYVASCFGPARQRPPTSSTITTPTMPPADWT